MCVRPLEHRLAMSNRDGVGEMDQRGWKGHLNIEQRQVGETKQRGGRREQ